MTIKPNPKHISSKQEAERILSKYDNFLFDCDGVIWLDEDLIPGVDKFLEWLTKTIRNLHLLVTIHQNHVMHILRNLKI